MSQGGKFGLSIQVIQSLQRVFSKHPGIEKVILYGSRAKGNFRPGSDIDLVLVAPSWGLERLLKVEGEIEELMLPYKVDLSLLHTIDSDDLIAHIERVGQVF